VTVRRALREKASRVRTASLEIVSCCLMTRARPSVPLPARLHHRPNNLRRILHAHVDPAQSDWLNAGEECRINPTASLRPSPAIPSQARSAERGSK
jgi:hypothetical protein